MRREYQNISFPPSSVFFACPMLGWRFLVKSHRICNVAGRKQEKQRALQMAKFSGNKELAGRMLGFPE